MLGVLMLETRFPRLRGDVGHAASWRMPVHFAVVRGASPERVVQRRDPALLGPFIAAGEQLVAAGARAITTSCGFLFAFQRELQATLPVPVWTSSLLALPQLPRPGVLTVDAASLAASELAGSVPCEGLAVGSHLRDVLLGDLHELDARQAEADAVAAARRLVSQHAGLSHIVLECTNLPPYERAIAEATALPVVHLMTLVHERWEALPHNTR